MRLSARSPLAMGLDMVSLPPMLHDRLRGIGVTTCVQFLDLLARHASHPEALCALGGGGLPDIARLMLALQAQIPAPARAALARCRYRVPRLTGLRGRALDSPVLMARRARKREERRVVVAALEHLEKRSDLPEEMLLTDWMSPVGDQRTLGSCVGWGTTAERELLAQAVLAALFGYALAKHFDGEPDIEGSYLAFAVEGFYKVGHLLEKEYPYTDTPEDLSIEPYVKSAARFRIHGAVDVLLDPSDMRLQPTLLKAILAGRLNGDLGPQAISVGLRLYESMNSAATSLYGLVSLPIPGLDAPLGGHAMCICGYVRLNGITYFTVKNSWGTAWAPENPLGLAGYALIPEAYFADPALFGEAWISLAEPSPVGRRGLLDLLSVTWDRAFVGPA